LDNTDDIHPLYRWIQSDNNDLKNIYVKECERMNLQTPLHKAANDRTRAYDKQQGEKMPKGTKYTDGDRQ